MSFKGIQYLHGRVREAALREELVALHAEQDLVVLDHAVELLLHLRWHGAFLVPARGCSHAQQLLDRARERHHLKRMRRPREAQRKEPRR